MAELEISLDDDIFVLAEHYAAENGTTVEALILDILSKLAKGTKD